LEEEGEIYKGCCGEYDGLEMNSRPAIIVKTLLRIVKIGGCDEFKAI
jgi:hypothetical protein